MQEQHINKLRIYSFKDDTFIKKLANRNDEIFQKYFEAQINPENWQRTHKITYKDPRESNTRSSVMQFEKIEPESLNIKLYFDGTGTVMDQTGNTQTGVSGNEENYVYNRIKKLKEFVYEYEGEEHRSPYVLVAWGKELFAGLLEEMTVNYNLFNPAGVPLRAEVNLRLKEHVSKEFQNAIQKNSSPDLTHKRTLKDGDRIYLLSQEIYKSPKYYLEIAKYNRLTNFRKLNLATVMTFPPIAKGSEQNK